MGAPCQTGGPIQSTSQSLRPTGDERAAAEDMAYVWFGCKSILRSRDTVTQ